ncbi:hypothetical protein [Nonomuraea candida]|uniref:hypothetical protein n=1 Tax=Nonomuraea candida TaxID=359159 RepID=UPI0005BD32E8|nr:hypothetical protein [Nonomuraea candida]
MTITTVEAPEADSDDLKLVPLPRGVLIPCIADWAITASMGGHPHSDRLGTLGLACLAVGADLETGHDGTDRDAIVRQRHLDLFTRLLAQVMEDIGPMNLVVAPAQARQIADTFHQAGATAQTVELDPDIIWGLLDKAGHSDHGGWTHDSRWPEVTCACGEAVLRLTVPAPAER